MPEILYEKSTGKQVIFAHVIDAKESLAGGFYTREDPNKKVEEKPVEVKLEDKPESHIPIKDINIPIKFDEIKEESKEEPAKPIISKKVPIKPIKKNSK